ncbi:MAG: 30S ribosomal protein S9 [Candidatus Spechtbacteria bacterium]|nr:30S ribosomal protein S9 [Candidatus Spechtbacteria bacterium]
MPETKKTTHKTPARIKTAATPKVAQSFAIEDVKPLKHETVKVAPAENEAEEAFKTPDRSYYEAVGRRKAAIARVRLYVEGDKKIMVNEREFAEFFSTEELRMLANGALRKAKIMDRFFVSVKTQGGGVRGQAEAMRLGTARALVLYNDELRTRLKRAGYLRRDPREVERKKFGYKKARRAPQWQKR